MRILLTVLLVLTGFSQLALADDQNPVVTVEVGKPVQIKFDEERIIELKLVDNFQVFSIPMVLTDNSCSRTIGSKFTFNLPVTTRSLVPIWIKHPKYQGKPVLKYSTDDKKMKINTANSLVWQNRPALFASRLEKSPSLDKVADEARLYVAKHPLDAGWIKCEGGCAGVLPAHKNVLFWDENFETEDTEIAMFKKDNNNPQVNQMTSRMLNVPLRVEGSRIIFGRPEDAMGTVNIFPAGVSYQLQWTFQAPNLVEPDDSLCLVKWDEDFTSIFTQFTATFDRVEDPSKFKMESLKEYLYSTEDNDDITLSYHFNASDWTGTGVQK